VPSQKAEYVPRESEMSIRKSQHENLEVSFHRWARGHLFSRKKYGTLNFTPPTQMPQRGIEAALQIPFSLKEALQ
jgi:hypothetical protein